MRDEDDTMRSHRRSRANAAWLASLFIMCFGGRNCPAGQEELLSLVRAGHRAARQSIHSFSAKVTREATFPNGTKIVLSGKYWRSLDTVRVQVDIGSGTEDFLLKNSEIRQVGQGADGKTGEKRYGAMRRAATETLSRLDVWTLMRIDFSGPSGGHYDFDRSLEFALDPPRLSRERKDGRDCIRIDFRVISNAGVEQKISQWHDIGFNYLVRKFTVTYERSSDRSEMDILEFAEPLPGLFIPVKCHSNSFRGKEIRSIEEVTLSDVQVNKPIPKSVFQLPAIPSGTELRDTIQGTRYPIDENWRPIGPSRPYVIVGFPAKSDSTESNYGSQSSSEARSSSWWLISGSLGVLVIVCIYRLYRHYRPRVDLT